MVGPVIFLARLKMASPAQLTFCKFQNETSLNELGWFILTALDINDLRIEQTDFTVQIQQVGLFHKVIILMHTSRSFQDLKLIHKVNHMLISPIPKLDNPCHHLHDLAFQFE